MTTATATRGVDRTVRVDPYGDGPITVTIRPLGREQWRDLTARHPARDTDDAPWNTDTFPPALLAASVTEVDDGDAIRAGIGVAEARHWWDEWPEDAAEALFLACIQASAPSSIEWALHALRRDPRLALEAGYCAEQGIDPAVFDTWTPRGRDLVLAAWVASKDHCAGCGVPSWAMRDRDAASVELVPCVHCETRHALLEDVPADHKHRVHAVVHLTRHGAGEG